MVIYMKFGFLVLFFASLYSSSEAIYECSKGVFACDLSQWLQWSTCTATCGGGVQKRIKPICCPANVTYSACSSGCNLTTADLEDRRSCAQTCSFGGVYDKQSGNCRCRRGYGGACCDIRPGSTLAVTTLKPSTQGASSTVAVTKLKPSTQARTASAARGIKQATKAAQTISTTTGTKQGANAGQPSIVDSAHESCFKKKSVTTLVTFLVIFVVCLAVASAILTYFILQLRKKLFGLQKSENPTSGGAPSSTVMTKS